MSYSLTVSIARKPGLSDPEGATTRKALVGLGFTSVSHVSYGRTIAIQLEADSEDEAIAAAEAMCEKLLANPVMETYTIETAS